MDRRTSARRRVAFLDVFAERPLAGNGLAVVDDADEPRDETMLAFAKETRLSETTFVQTAERRRRRLPQPDLDPGRGAPLRGPPLAGDRGRGRALARARRGRATSSRPAPGCSRSRCGIGRRRALARVDAPGADRVRGRARARRRDGGGRAGGRATPTPSWRRRSSRPACRHVIVPLAEAAALARAEPDYRGDRRAARPARQAVVLYLVCVRPRAGAGPRAQLLRIVASSARTPRPARPPARSAPTSPSAPGPSA